MSTYSFQFSNEEQREYQKVMSHAEWICIITDSYTEAYSRLKELTMFGDKLFDSTIISILESKETLKLNPKLKKKGKKVTGKGVKKGR